MSREKDEIAITAEKLGIRKLKPEQREVISRVLGQKDALAIFPVGFGKSAIARFSRKPSKNNSSPPILRAALRRQRCQSANWIPLRQMRSRRSSTP